MSVGAVNKSTGERIPTAGNPLDKVGDLSLLHTSAKSNAVAAINEVADEVATKQDTLTFDDVPTDNSNNPVKSNGIYDALALKQDATDNSLETTAKTIVGAINEHEGDISTLMSGLNGLISIGYFSATLAVGDNRLREADGSAGTAVTSGDLPTGNDVFMYVDNAGSSNSATFSFHEDGSGKIKVIHCNTTVAQSVGIKWIQFNV